MRALERQTNYETAFAQAVEQVKSQPHAALASLGARVLSEGRYELPVLDGVFVVDLPGNTVTVKANEQLRTAKSGAGLAWQILVLHYLGAPAPYPDPQKWLSFADFQDARGYETVYRARVVGRLCGTAGSRRDTFAEACRRLGGEHAEWGDEGFVFNVFPRVQVAIAWYAGDDEIPVDVSFVYPDNILSFLSIEDVTVLSERLVGRLQGRGW